MELGSALSCLIPSTAESYALGLRSNDTISDEELEAENLEDQDGALMLTFAIQMERNVLNRAAHHLLRARLFRQPKYFTLALADLSQSAMLVYEFSQSQNMTNTHFSEDSEIAERLVDDLTSHLFYLGELIGQHARCEYEHKIEQWWEQEVHSKLALDYSPSPKLFGSPFTPKAPSVASPSSKQVIPVALPLTWPKKAQILHTAIFKLWPLLVDPLSLSTHNPSHYTPNRQISSQPKSSLKAGKSQENFISSYSAPSEVAAGMLKAKVDADTVPAFLHAPPYAIEVGATTEGIRRFSEFLNNREEFSLNPIKICFNAPKDDGRPARLTFKVTQNISEGEIFFRERDVEWSGLTPCLCARKWPEEYYSENDRCGHHGSGKEEMEIETLLAAKYDIPELTLIRRIFAINDPSRKHSIRTQLSVHWTEARRIQNFSNFGFSGSTSSCSGSKTMQSSMIVGIQQNLKSMSINPSTNNGEKTNIECVSLESFDTDTSSESSPSQPHNQRSRDIVRPHDAPRFPLHFFYEIWSQLPYNTTLDFCSFLDMLSIIKSNTYPIDALKRSRFDGSGRIHCFHCDLLPRWSPICYPLTTQLLRVANSKYEANVTPNIEAHGEKLQFQLAAKVDLVEGDELCFYPPDIVGYDWCYQCADDRSHQRAKFV